MAIELRRFALPHQPLHVGYVAFEAVPDEGRVYIATEVLSRLFLTEIREKYGRRAVVKLRLAVRSELEQEVRERRRFVTNPAACVEMLARPRMHEHWLAMAGVTEKRESA